LQRFTEALGDDLNISSALAAVFDLIREVNSLCDSEKIGREDALQVIELMRKFDTLLGVLSFDKREEIIPEELQEAFAKRMQARECKNWKLADEMRDFIHQRGYLIEDTPNGPKLKKE
jgi:cysteinyl-tRNA synthetase